MYQVNIFCGHSVSHPQPTPVTCHWFSSMYRYFSLWYNKCTYRLNDPTCNDDYSPTKQVCFTVEGWFVQWTNPSLIPPVKRIQYRNRKIKYLISTPQKIFPTSHRFTFPKWPLRTTSICLSTCCRLPSSTFTAFKINTLVDSLTVPYVDKKMLYPHER